MKFFLVLLSFVSVSALADRWIVKNSLLDPESIARKVKIISTINFSSNRYLVIDFSKPNINESTRDVVLSLRSLLKAEDVFRDFPIRVDAPNMTDPVGPAWHVSALHYTELPVQFDGRGAVVAVLDSGVEYTHTALAPHMWTNAKEIPGNKIDDDGNGFVDDVYGYDFSNNSGNPVPTSNHGTHCAGIVVADPSPFSDAQGVATGAKIMSVKIFGSSTTFLSEASAAIKYSVDQGANILSNSWRLYSDWDDYDPSEQNTQMLKDAISYAGSKNVLFVAAAGNESININESSGSNPIFPVGYTGLDNLVGVASSDVDGTPSYFTNYGDQFVQVAAPGSNIISTALNNKWMTMSGTSMATPLIAGALARGLSMGLAPREAVKKLILTSNPSAEWTSRVTSGGIVNLIDYLK